MHRYIPASLLAWALCGITAVATAAPPPGASRAQQRVYRNARVCCSDPTEFQFVDMSLPGQRSLEIGPTSRLFDFHSGRSFFAALRLPEASSSYRVRIKSLLQGKGDATRVFYPVVALLNDNFIVTRLSSPSHLRLEPALATPGGEPGLSLNLRVDPSEARERYLVVFTPALLLGAPPEERREGDVLTDTTTDYLERKGDSAIPAAVFGRLQVSVIPDTAEPPSGEGGG